MGFQRGLAPIIAVLVFALLAYAVLRPLWVKVLKPRLFKAD